MIAFLDWMSYGLDHPLRVLFVVLVLVVTWVSTHRIGPTEVGLVNKRWSLSRLRNDNPIAFQGEAGYQAELLMPGLRFKLWPLFSAGASRSTPIPSTKLWRFLRKIPR